MLKRVDYTKLVHPNNIIRIYIPYNQFKLVITNNLEKRNNSKRINLRKISIETKLILRCLFEDV
jgi:hypothetical protein